MAVKAKGGKKKGPKGKKARAKAKLDRQWGESAVIDDEKTTRVGKSRLLGRKAARERGAENESDRNERTVRWESDDNLVQTPKWTPGKSRRRRDDDDIVFSDSDDDSNEEATPVMEGLLKSIRSQKRKQKRSAEVSDESDDDDDMDMDMEESDNEDGRAEDLESRANLVLNTADSDDEESGDEGRSGEASIDYFKKHFGRKPLKPSEWENQKPSVNKFQLHNALELQLSIPNVHGSSPDALEAESGTTAAQHFQSLASSCFRGNRKVLQSQWTKVHGPTLTEGQVAIYPMLAQYMDMLITTDSRKDRKKLHNLYQLHILNHVLTSRGRIQRNNRQLKELETDSDDDTKEKSARDQESFRDQGFTRPSVLVLLPTRGACHTFVHGLRKLAGVSDDIQHSERFEEEFGHVEAEEDEEAPLEPEKEKRRKQVLQQKGKDWNELFGDEANQDDDFKIGISLAPKSVQDKKKAKEASSNVNLRLYTDFFKSDIIVTSPIGLKMMISPDEEGKEGNYDYLSSIEICLLQQADVLMMQNWDHCNFVLNLLNKTPQSNNDTDFSRVRNYLLEEQAPHWRQLIVSTDFTDPHLLSSFKRFAVSVSGSVKVKRKVEPEGAAIAKVLIPMKQAFQKVQVSSFDQQTDGRVSFFVKNILPDIRKQKQKHVLVYIPSYFDFVALRNIFLKKEIEFVSVHEYSRITEVSRGRARFLQGRKPIMLYTGRCNFFHRHMIKGARHLIFLGLPEHPEFYADQVNFIETESQRNGDDADMAHSDFVDKSCLALFTKFEGHALERIVGSSNCTRMLKSTNNTFAFYS
eukprot:Nitzschia sp. Nitz4//scaffold89_size161592//108098//110593//NITZ4_002388-RA/size161592-snap-gene-0.177-mRNA-1//-1//CDS//3329559646//932//frame0